MVKYYYDKFTSSEHKVYNDDAPWEYLNTSKGKFEGGYKNYTFNGITNTYTPTDAWNYSDWVPVDGVAYDKNDDNYLFRFITTQSGQASDELNYVLHQKVRTKNTSSIAYQKGTLVQSNIAAEDGTYPANGRHTDGYWYVKVAIVNTAPSQPGSFTQPSDSLEIGDSKVFTVGVSVDAEGNLSKYIWEVSVNNAAYSKVGETTTPNFTYTIPTATSLKMRVKAVDTGGLESAYRESSQYTVTKPKYYWSKYNVNTNVTYNEPSWGSEHGSYDSVFAGKAKSYSWNSSTGKFVLSSSVYSSSEMVSDGAYAYAIFGTELYRYKWNYGSYPASNPGGKYAAYKDSANATTNTTYSRGSLVQSNIQAEEGAYPTDGRHTDGYWYVRGSRVSQTIAPPSPFTEPVSGKKFKPNEVANIAFGASSAPNLSLYEVDFRYNITGAWASLAYNNALTRSLTITTDKALKTLELRVRAKNTSNVYSDYVYSEAFTIEHNVAPTVSLTSPAENETLYENDILKISGTASDPDADQSVTVYYQINSEQRKVLATNLSQTQISLSKQLKFSGGKLYDGDNVLTGNLADGVAHKLKVWATDSEGASSIIVERTFYVVPNRVPLLSVDTVVPGGVINNDKFKISGTASDPDANSTVKVTRRINNADAVEIYSGTGGVWEFDISLGQLKVGENVIVVEVIDNYGAKTSKTIKLNKNAVNTPTLQSVARYKIEPPKGSAKGVLLWVQRDKELDLTVELSMTLKGEQEQYVLLEVDLKNIVPVTDKIVEDEYYHETVEPKDNIILKLTTTRANINIDHKIYLIMGVVE
ncbi:Ig-like domain-containing protein [Lysinibacillus sp. CTST325]